MVNVWGGECLDGERLTIDKHIRTNKIDNFDPPATVPDVYMIKIPVIREGLKNGNLEWN